MSRCVCGTVRRFFIRKKMPQTKSQKQKIIEVLREKIDRQKAMFFIDVKGLKVKDISALKKNLKAVEAQLQVAKKTLLGLVFQERAVDIKIKALPGQVALVLGFEDVAAPAKAIYEFSQKNKLAILILGGYMEGRFRSAEDVVMLAKLPTRQELFAKVVGSIAFPMTGLVSVLDGNIKGLIRVLAKAKTS